jgi:hypothetical protein
VQLTPIFLVKVSTILIHYIICSIAFCSSRGGPGTGHPKATQAGGIGIRQGVFYPEDLKGPGSSGGGSKFWCGFFESF